MPGTFNWIKAFRGHATYILKARFYGQPDDIEMYRGKLGGKPKFNQSENAIHYPLLCLEQKNPDFNPYSYQVLLERAEVLTQSFIPMTEETSDVFTSNVFA